jgi:glycosyltransferase involved in cell wall biosynthesis
LAGDTRSADSIDALPAYDVVVPAYNAAETLAETLASLLIQTHPPQALIVANDASTDNTVAVASRFTGVRVETYPHSGLAGVQNLALDATRARLIAFVDADDIWAPNTGAYLAQALTDGRWVAAGVRSVPFRHGERVPEWSDTLRGTWRELGYRELLRSDNPLTKSGTMFNRSRLDDIGGYDVDLSAVEDLDLALRLTEGGATIAVSDWSGVGYRQWPSSMSRDPRTMVLMEAKVVLPRLEREYGPGHVVLRRRAFRIWLRAAARAANDHRELTELPALSEIAAHFGLPQRVLARIVRSPAQGGIAATWRSVRRFRKALLTLAGVRRGL